MHTELFRLQLVSYRLLMLLARLFIQNPLRSRWHQAIECAAKHKYDVLRSEKQKNSRELVREPFLRRLHREEHQGTVGNHAGIHHQEQCCTP